MLFLNRVGVRSEPASAWASERLITPQIGAIRPALPEADVHQIGILVLSYFGYRRK